VSERSDDLRDSPSSTARVPEQLLERARLVFLLRSPPAAGWQLHAAAGALELLNLPSEEVPGADFGSLIHEADRDQIRQALDSRAGLQPFELEYRLIGRAGEVRWVREHSVVEEQGGQRLERCLLADVSEQVRCAESARVAQGALERKVSDCEQHERHLTAQARAALDAERALRESEERLRVLINASPDIICFKDCEGRWLEANQAAIDLFELHGVDYRGKTDSELAKHSPFFTEPFFVCEVTDEVAWLRSRFSRCDEVVSKPSGVVKVFDAIKVPVFAPDGSRRGLVVLGRDVTEQKKAEHALRKSERNLAALVAALPDGVALLDESGRLSLLNPSGERILGVEAKALLGKEHTELPFASMRANGRLLGGPNSPLERLWFHGEPIQGVEAKFERPDGSRATVLVNATCLQNGERTILIAFQDLSARAELDRLRTEFMDVASHELRTPLTPLSLILQRAMRRASKGELLESGTLERMQRHVKRLIDLVGALLDVSRLERGEIVIKPQTIDLAALAASTVEDFQQQAHQRAIALRVHRGPTVVRADPVRIEQVLANLLDNAVRYTPEGSSVEVEITGGEDRVRLAVIDHGSGLPPEVCQRIFDRFFRATTSMTAKQAGFGLGLFNARQFVEQHGGTLECDSKPGKGTTFTITLPAAKPEAD
jgi:two-component system, sporulation sensor kinase E